MTVQDIAKEIEKTLVELPGSIFWQDDIPSIDHVRLWILYPIESPQDFLYKINVLHNQSAYTLNNVEIRNSNSDPNLKIQIIIIEQVSKRLEFLFLDSKDTFIFKSPQDELIKFYGVQNEYKITYLPTDLVVNGIFSGRRTTDQLAKQFDSLGVFIMTIPFDRITTLSICLDEKFKDFHMRSEEEERFFSLNHGPGSVGDLDARFIVMSQEVCNAELVRCESNRIALAPINIHDTRGNTQVMQESTDEDDNLSRILAERQESLALLHENLVNMHYLYKVCSLNDNQDQKNAAQFEQISVQINNSLKALHNLNYDDIDLDCSRSSMENIEDLPNDIQVSDFETSLECESSVKDDVKWSNFGSGSKLPNSYFVLNNYYHLMTNWYNVKSLNSDMESFGNLQDLTQKTADAINQYYSDLTYQEMMAYFDRLYQLRIRWFLFLPMNSQESILPSYDICDKLERVYEKVYKQLDSQNYQRLNETFLKTPRICKEITNLSDHIDGKGESVEPAEKFFDKKSWDQGLIKYKDCVQSLKDFIKGAESLELDSSECVEDEARVMESIHTAMYKIINEKATSSVTIPIIKMDSDNTKFFMELKKALEKSLLTMTRVVHPDMADTGLFSRIQWSSFVDQFHNLNPTSLSTSNLPTNSELIEEWTDFLGNLKQFLSYTQLYTNSIPGQLTRDLEKVPIYQCPYERCLSTVHSILSSLQNSCENIKTFIAVSLLSQTYLAYLREWINHHQKVELEEKVTSIKRQIFIDLYTNVLNHIKTFDSFLASANRLNYLLNLIIQTIIRPTGVLHTAYGIKDLHDELIACASSKATEETISSIQESNLRRIKTDYSRILLNLQNEFTQIKRFSQDFAPSRNDSYNFREEKESLIVGLVIRCLENSYHPTFNDFENKLHINLMLFERKHWSELITDWCIQTKSIIAHLHGEYEKKLEKVNVDNKLVHTYLRVLRLLKVAENYKKTINHLIAKGQETFRKGCGSANCSRNFEVVEFESILECLDDITQNIESCLSMLENQLISGDKKQIKSILQQSIENWECFSSLTAFADWFENTDLIHDDLEDVHAKKVLTHLGDQGVLVKKIHLKRWLRFLTVEESTIRQIKCLFETLNEEENDLEPQLNNIQISINNCIRLSNLTRIMLNKITKITNENLIFSIDLRPRIDLDSIDRINTIIMKRRTSGINTCNELIDFLHEKNDAICQSFIDEVTLERDNLLHDYQNILKNENILLLQSLLKAYLPIESEIYWHSKATDKGNIYDSINPHLLLYYSSASNGKDENVTRSTRSFALNRFMNKLNCWSTIVQKHGIEKYVSSFEDLLSIDTSAGLMDYNFVLDSLRALKTKFNIQTMFYDKACLQDSTNMMKRCYNDLKHIKQNPTKKPEESPSSLEWIDQAILNNSLNASMTVSEPIAFINYSKHADFTSKSDLTNDLSRELNEKLSQCQGIERAVSLEKFYQDFITICLNTRNFERNRTELNSICDRITNELILTYAFNLVKFGEEECIQRIVKSCNSVLYLITKREFHLEPYTLQDLEVKLMVIKNTIYLHLLAYQVLSSMPRKDDHLPNGLKWLFNFLINLNPLIETCQNKLTAIKHAYDEISRTISRLKTASLVSEKIISAQDSIVKENSDQCIPHHQVVRNIKWLAREVSYLISSECIIEEIDEAWNLPEGLFTAFRTELKDLVQRTRKILNWIKNENITPIGYHELVNSALHQALSNPMNIFKTNNLYNVYKEFENKERTFKRMSTITSCPREFSSWLSIWMMSQIIERSSSLLIGSKEEQTISRSMGSLIDSLKGIYRKLETNFFLESSKISDADVAIPILQQKLDAINTLLYDVNEEVFWISLNNEFPLKPGQNNCDKSEDPNFNELTIYLELIKTFADRLQEVISQMQEHFVYLQEIQLKVNQNYIEISRVHLPKLEEEEIALEKDFNHLSKLALSSNNEGVIRKRFDDIEKLGLRLMMIETNMGKISDSNQLMQWLQLDPLLRKIPKDDPGLMENLIDKFSICDKIGHRLEDVYKKYKDFIQTNQDSQKPFKDEISKDFSAKEERIRKIKVSEMLGETSSENLVNDLDPLERDESLAKPRNMIAHLRSKDPSNKKPIEEDDNILFRETTSVVNNELKRLSDDSGFAGNSSSLKSAPTEPNASQISQASELYQREEPIIRQENPKPKSVTFIEPEEEIIIPVRVDRNDCNANPDPYDPHGSSTSQNTSSDESNSTNEYFDKYSTPTKTKAISWPLEDASWRLPLCSCFLLLFAVLLPIFYNIFTLGNCSLTQPCGRRNGLFNIISFQQSNRPQI